MQENEMIMLKEKISYLILLFETKYLLCKISCLIQHILLLFDRWKTNLENYDILQKKQKIVPNLSSFLHISDKVDYLR